MTALSDPATALVPITPSDSVTFSPGYRGLLVSVGGTLQVTDGSGTTRALTVPAGQVNGHVLQVWATNTTATGITGLL